jgi:hypothetical protein
LSPGPFQNSHWCPRDKTATLERVKRFSFLAGLLLGGALWPAGAARGADATALEFRGVMQSGGKVMVGLFDRATGRTFWTKVPAKSVPPPKEISVGIAVRDYDPEHNRLSVDYQGHTYTLVLSEAQLLYEPPPPEPAAPGETGAPAEAAKNATGGGEVPRRQSLAQVEAANQLLRAAGADESQLLQGNPQPAAPAADAATQP